MIISISSRKTRDLSKNVVKIFSDIADKYGTKNGGVNKLVPNLGNKRK